MNRLSQKIASYIPFIKNQQPPPRQEALSSRPVRNTLVRWEKTEENEVMLLIPMRKDRMARFMSRIMKIPDKDRQIILDEIGGSIWEMCDGKMDLNTIINSVVRGHKLTRREAEISVTAFFRMLAQRNLIALAVGGSKGAGQKAKR
ncbi:MAG: PqqD family protein [Armatimonadota bacterium]